MRFFKRAYKRGAEPNPKTEATSSIRPRTCHATRYTLVTEYGTFIVSAARLRSTFQMEREDGTVLITLETKDGVVITAPVPKHAITSNLV